MNIKLPELSDAEIKKAGKHFNLKIIAVFLSVVTLVITNYIIVEVSVRNEQIRHFFFESKGVAGSYESTIYYSPVMGVLALMYFFLYFNLGKILKRLLKKS